MQKCLNCNEEFIGRSDKKYCSDQCRSEAYNKKNVKSSKYMRDVHKILQRNRQILMKLNPSGKARVHRDQLNKHGYRFDFFTNIYTTRAGKEYYFCYEHGYIQTGDDFFTLVVRDVEKLDP